MPGEFNRISREQRELLKTLYGSHGLESAMHYLFSLLAVNTRAKKLLITVRHVDSNNLLILGDIRRDSADFYREIIMEKLAPSDFRSVFFYADTAHSYYFENADTDSSLLASQTTAVFPGHKSIFSVPMFAVTGYAAYMMVGAEEERSFSELDLEYFKECAQTFGEELKTNYVPHLIDTPSPVVQYSLEPIQMLRMCGGLARVTRLAEHVGPTNATVLILGETGTGKEILARAIHILSRRASAPFVRVNSGAIPESLLMSELFGHERGAFTGAAGAHAGYFEQANGGTLFLDEIGELSPAAQVALLRVLSTGEIQRIGSTRTTHVNVRLIAATHQSLKQKTQEGQFRQDLFYRLNVFPIFMPPLRSRRMDIPVLARFFLELKSTLMDVPTPSLPQSELHRLSLAPWPGNVRELEHAVERAVIMSSSGLAKGVSFPELTNLDGAGLESLHSLGDWPTLDDLNKQYIQRVLEYTQGKLKGPDGACALLDIPPSTLRGRLKQYGIPLPKGRKIPRVRNLKN